MNESAPQNRGRLTGADFAVASVFVVVGLILFCVGALSSARDTEKTRIDLSALEDGHATTQRWVALQGEVHADDIVTLDGAGAGKHFVPITTSRAKSNVPMALFLEASNEQLDEVHHASRFHTFDGMLQPGGLPTAAHSEFQSRGRTVANNYYVLKLHKIPADEQRSAKEYSIIGGASMVVAVLWLVVQLFRNRNSALPITARDPRFEIKQIKL